MSQARTARIRMLNQYLEEDKHDHFSRYALGLELMETGDVAGAISHFKVVLSENESFLAVYYQLGKALEKLALPQDASEIYQRGLAIATVQKNAKTASELKMALDSLAEDTE